MDLEIKNQLLHDCLVVIENLLSYDKIPVALHLASIVTSGLQSEKEIRDFITTIKLK